MFFRAMHRPGEGFKLFKVLRREGGKTAKGRPTTSALKPHGEFHGIISRASPKEIERHKQLGTPISHTIIQHGTTNRAKATDILELEDGSSTRRFLVQGDPRNPGELGHFTVYKVEERDDLQ